jgi:hypothetical protein
MNTSFLTGFAHFQDQFPNLGGLGIGCLKSTAMFLLAAGTATMLKSQSARARNWVWRCALAGLLALACWQFLPGSPRLVALTAQPAAPAPLVRASAQESFKNPGTEGGLGGTEQRRAKAEQALVSLEKAVPFLWMGAGFALFAAHLARSALAVAWLRRHASRLEQASVPVYRTGLLDTPLLAGWWRPAIFLPASSGGWSEEKCGCVLRHELAHRSRGDLGWQLLGTLACCLWWWNPLAWRALASLKAEAEQAADDLVVEQEASAETYARHLVEIAAACGRPAPAGIPMLGRSSLELRIGAILDRTLVRNRIGAWSGGLLAALSCLMLFCLSVGIAWAADLTNGRGEIVHYEANPSKDALARGNFRLTQGSLEGWSGSLDNAAKGGADFIRLKSGETASALETGLPCRPEWKWLTVMARIRPVQLDEGQAASVTFTPVDAAGKATGPAAELAEKRRSGYTNWTTRYRTIAVAPGTARIAVRISLPPGKGQIDCSEILVVPSRPEDELDHPLVASFFDALEASDKDKVLALLKREPRLANTHGWSDNSTPLILCAWNELPEMAQLLIDHGADVNMADYGAWKSPPLAWCGWWGSVKTAQVLLNAGANAKHKTPYGVTPLSSARDGKQGNGFRKATPEAYDATIALFTRAGGG